MIPESVEDWEPQLERPLLSRCTVKEQSLLTMQVTSSMWSTKLSSLLLRLFSLSNSLNRWHTPMVSEWTITTPIMASLPPKNVPSILPRMISQSPSVELVLTTRIPWLRETWKQWSIKQESCCFMLLYDGLNQLMQAFGPWLSPMLLTCGTSLQMSTQDFPLLKSFVEPSSVHWSFNPNMCRDA